MINLYKKTSHNALVVETPHQQKRINEPINYINSNLPCRREKKRALCFRPTRTRTQCDVGRCQSSTVTDRQGKRPTAELHHDGMFCGHYDTEN